MEEFRKILIPTDGSEYTMAAVRKGLSLARLINAEVTALYVIDESTFSGIPPDSLITDVYSLLQQEGERAVSAVKEMGEAMGVRVTTKIRSGVPAPEIVEEAEEHDLIVMGTLGRTGLDKLLLGSVAERVVRHAPCPVMLIRVRE
jgi:nucleotide-binding universal stress UspA family protein